MKSFRKLSSNLALIVLVLTPNIFAINQSILQNTPSVSDSVTQIIFQGGILSGFGDEVCNGDFNGDGIDDIVVTSIKPNETCLLISQYFMVARVLIQKLIL